MSKNEENVLRANILGGMNDYIINVLGDEDIMMDWFAIGVEDGADEDILMEYGADEAEFKRICKVFAELIV